MGKAKRFNAVLLSAGRATMRLAASAFAAASVFLVGAAGCGQTSLHARAAQAAHGRVSFTIVKATVVAPTSPDVSVLANKTDGTFRVVRYVGDSPGVAVADAVADGNGDGKPDVVTANSDVADSNKLDKGSISVFLSRGDGSFAPRRDYLIGGGADAIAVGDLNGDDRPDVAVTRGEAGPFISVLLNRG